MVQPIDYRLNVQSPFEAAIQGFQLGAAGQEAQAQRQAREAAILEAQRVQKNNEAVQALINNPRATLQQYQAVAATLPEGQRKFLQDSFAALSKEQQNTQLQIGGQVMSALAADRLDIATDILTKRAEAERNSGQEDKAKATEATIELMKVNPGKAHVIFGPTMAASGPEFENVLDNVTKALAPPETKDPWVIVPGVGVFPRAQLEAAAKQAEAKGAPDVTITANIPDGAAADLKAGRVSKATFDSVFGAGKADKILGVKK